MTHTTSISPIERGTSDADVSSVDAIIAALYEAISGPAGVPRDWARSRHLFAPGARLMPVAPTPDGDVRLDIFDVGEYERSRSPMFESMGFYEMEIARRTERFGCITHVFSTYEARHVPGDRPFIRGINSIQLLWRDGRWWVLSVFWQHEGTGAPIPARYLRSAERAPAEGGRGE